MAAEDALLVLVCFLSPPPGGCLACSPLQFAALKRHLHTVSQHDT